MSASFSPFPSYGAPGAARARLRGQFTPLAIIAAVHALALYGVYSGLLHRVVTSAMPAEVFVSFIAAPPEPPPAPQPPAEMQELPPPAVTVPLPVISIAPVERVISQPAPAAPVAEKAAPADGVSAAVSSAAATGAGTAPATPAAAPRIITSGVQYVRAPQPEYPALSMRMGEHGKVILRVLVNENGLPEQVVVQTSSGYPRLDEAGRQAALGALFKAHMDDGRPVSVFVIVPLNFQMTN